MYPSSVHSFLRVEIALAMRGREARLVAGHQWHIVSISRANRDRREMHNANTPPTSYQPHPSNRYGPAGADAERTPARTSACLDGEFLIFGDGWADGIRLTVEDANECEGDCARRLHGIDPAAGLCRVIHAALWLERRQHRACGHVCKCRPAHRRRRTAPRSHRPHAPGSFFANFSRSARWWAFGLARQNYPDMASPWFRRAATF